jgi:RNA polymerase sigma-70 factor (ECF subfamily)
MLIQSVALELGNSARVSGGVLLAMASGASARPSRSRMNSGGIQDMAPTMEQRLLDVAIDRDRDAFGAVFSHFAPRVKGFMMRRNCPPDLAEELAQETLIRVWRKAHIFDPAKAAASTWIFTIARNLHIDRVRRENRPEPDPDDPFFAQEPEPAPDTIIDGVRQAEQLRRAVSELPEEQQKVVKLSFFEEASHADIAEHLNIPLGTVKSRLRLAFGHMRKALGEIR